MTGHQMNMKQRIGRNVERALDGMTNADVARETGKSEREIRRWRKGEVTPGEDNLAAIAYVAGITDLSWFYLPHDEDGSEVAA